MTKRNVNWSISQKVYDRLKIMALFNDCSISNLIEQIADKSFDESQKHIERWQNNLST